MVAMMMMMICLFVCTVLCIQYDVFICVYCSVYSICEMLGCGNVKVGQNVFRLQQQKTSIVIAKSSKGKSNCCSFSNGEDNSASGGPIVWLSALLLVDKHKRICNDFISRACKNHSLLSEFAFYGAGT
jgi:hypothetical protein